MKLGPLFAALALAGAVIAAGYWVKNSSSAPVAAAAKRGGGGGSGRRAVPTDVPAPVTVARVTKQSVPVYREGIGNVQALNAVTVRTQVDGRLMSVDFVEGQDVRKGDVLARIDPVTFKAQYDQAVAKKAQDEANLANARMDLDRYRRLAQTNAGPKQQADQQASQVAQLEAQVKSDQAAIDNAKAILDYATIASPLDGRAGLRQVDPGNIVHASDANGIVSVTQVKPIAVLFTLPQRDVAVTSAALSRGAVNVEIPSADGTGVAARGSLQSIDNQIDVTTGTVKLKANFPNADLKLWPGQFVSIRVVVETLVDAKVIPASAVRRGASGNFVYVVGDDAKAVVKPVKLALQNEAIAVVRDGVEFDQTVVVEGFARLTDGKDVQVTTPATPASAIDTAPSSRNGSAKRDGQRGQNKAAAPSQPSADAAAPQPAKTQDVQGIQPPETPQARPIDAPKQRRSRPNDTTPGGQTQAPAGASRVEVESKDARP